MRISTQVFYQRSTETMFTRQAELSQQTVRLSSGKRVLYASDDASAMATIQRLKQNISMGEQYLKNADMAESASQLEETALTQVTNILQRVRELTVSAGNGTYSDSDREAIAIELESLCEELMGVANTQDSSSQYIFAGFEVDTEPFQEDEFGNIQYYGDNGTSSYKVGSGVSVQANDSGSSVFMDIAEGNGTFVSEVNENNTGSGVLSSASIIDSNEAKAFLDQDYTIAISDSVPAGEMEYSVYGLKESSVTGDATVKISKIDLTDTDIANVNPTDIYPATNSEVSIEFIATANPDEFEITINGQSSLPTIYDASNTTTQEITIDGISVEIDGVPDDADQYSLIKYISPTTYTEDQSIEFNGIKTQLKGEVNEYDSFALTQSGTKDIFSTIQDTVDALRITGDDASSAQRETRLEMSLNQIDNAMSNLSEIVTLVGVRMNTIDNQQESNQDFNLTNETTLSSLEDLDMAAAISEYQLQTTLLEVSQETFTQLQALTLFKLI